MKQSEIVIALANMASRGRYDITLPEAAEMNKLFVRAAALVKELEEAEKYDPKILKDEADVK